VGGTSRGRGGSRTRAAEEEEGRKKRLEAVARGARAAGCGRRKTRMGREGVGGGGRRAPEHMLVPCGWRWMTLWAPHVSATLAIHVGRLEWIGEDLDLVETSRQV